MTDPQKRNFFVLGALAMLLVVWAIQARLSRLRDEHRLSPAVQQPAEVIPILVLGGFRSVVVDLLWVRAMARHEEHRFFELRTLYDLIANLQPNIPDVWIFQGWNMAYNIAHNMATPQGKWKWVKSGLDYVERGIAHNPTNGEICAALANMYSNKFDPAVFPVARIQYYRKRLAQAGIDNVEEAVKWYRQAIALGLQITDECVLARCIPYTYFNAGRLELRLGAWANAVKRFERCIEAWEAYTKAYPKEAAEFAPPGITRACYGLAQAHVAMATEAEAKGRVDQALTHYMAMIAAYDRVTRELGAKLTPRHARWLSMAEKKAAALAKTH